MRLIVWQLESFLSPSTMLRARVTTACIVSATGFGVVGARRDGADISSDTLRGIDRKHISLCFLEQGRDGLERDPERREG